MTFRFAHELCYGLGCRTIARRLGQNLIFPRPRPRFRIVSGLLKITGQICLDLDSRVSAL